MAVTQDVLVVVGIGGMGQAIARRLGGGRALLVADVDGDRLEAARDALAREGHSVTALRVDVSDPRSVAELAGAAARLGPVRSLAYTSGLSPVQASADAVVRVDVLGVAYALEEFGGVMAPGGAGVVIASMAGHLAPPMPPEDEAGLARTPARELAGLACVERARQADSGSAYAFAKRANALRVRAASVEWGRRGARINSISPGVIATSMGQAELDGPAGAVMRSMIEASGTGRVGTPDEIAAATAFLLGPDASFVTGTDLLVDGGVVGSLLSGPATPTGSTPGGTAG